MSVQKILEYQKIDLNIYKKEKAFAQSNEMKYMMQCKEEVKNKRNMLDELLAELDKCYALLTSLDEKMADAETGKASLETDFEGFKDLKDFDKYEKELDKYEESVGNIAKEITRIVKKISEINDTNKKVNDQITRLVNEFNKAKVATEDKRKELLKEAVPFAKQLKEMEPSLDEKLLAKYRELRTKKKMPAFVPYSDGSCLGCGIGIELEVGKAMVNPFDWAECPHCGRIVYKI